MPLEFLTYDNCRFAVSACCVVHRTSSSSSFSFFAIEQFWNTSQVGKEENRVLTAAIEEAGVERGATQFRSGGKELRLPHTGTRHEHFHRREKLEGKARSSDESSSHLDESVTRSIQYSTFAKRPPSSDFYLWNSTIHHREYFSNFSYTESMHPKCPTYFFSLISLRIFLGKEIIFVNNICKFSDKSRKFPCLIIFM